MLLTTRVKLVLAEEPETVLTGVRVVLFDRDEHDQDDFLAEGITDGRGEVFFSFQSHQYADLEDQPEWRIESLPDLYVILYDSQDRQVLTTREQAQIDRLPLLITVPVARQIAQQHELI